MKKMLILLLLGFVFIFASYANLPCNTPDCNSDCCNDQGDSPTNNNGNPESVNFC